VTPYRVIIFGESSPAYLAARTMRAIADGRICREDLSGRSTTDIADRLAEVVTPVWFLRAGSWPMREVPSSALPRSSTGRALCALGATLATPNTSNNPDVDAWQAALKATGGHFEEGRCHNLPPLDSLYLEPSVVAGLFARLQHGEEFMPAVLAELVSEGRRVVRVPALDVHRDASLRVAQVITSLQRGGAERIALDLHRALGQGGIRSLLVSLGHATRAAFEMPDNCVDVSQYKHDRAWRVGAAVKAVRSFSADVVHGHLLETADIRQFSAAGLPLMLTIHNMRPGWPDGLETLAAGDATLLVACARAVEEELRAASMPIPLRTVWNGVDFGPYGRTPAAQEAGHAMRRQLGISPEAFVLVALANPRPQKRMERLPAIIAATREEFHRRRIDREVVLLVAGQPSRVNPTAIAAEAALRAAIDGHELNGHVHVLGAVEDVSAVLAASDALLSVSAYEGLSLAQVEALAAERAMVATAVGGNAELAWGNPAARLLSVDATPTQFAAVLADIAESPPASGRAAAERDFSTKRTTAGYRRLYAAAIAAHGRVGQASFKRAQAHQDHAPNQENGGPSLASSFVPPYERSESSGLWLITNNFSMGGAQSSAARLLRGLAAEGVPVRAAVLQEQPDYPTPGRQRLQAAGIDVVGLPPPGTIDPADAVAELHERIAADAPRAALLWNVIPEYKVLLADMLLDVPLFDVSPGEMYFASLERYFRCPRPGLPYRTPREYGTRLTGAIVKYRAEAAVAAERLGAAVHVVPNGVPLDPMPAAHAARPTLVLGTAARISPQKKLEELLAAVRLAADRLPPYELRIAGGVETGADEYSRQICEQARGLNVQWLGELADPSAFYRDLDLFVMISEPAGCPNASLEAMSAGLPVVATDFGGACEQVIDGATGRIVPRGDAAAFAAAILDYGCNRQLRAAHGSAGRQRIAEHFDVARMVRDYRRALGL
jgi:glycosyltransferase involved in cell wall biosynthesis